MKSISEFALKCFSAGMTGWQSRVENLNSFFVGFILFRSFSIIDAGGSSEARDQGRTLAGDWQIVRLVRYRSPFFDVLLFLPAFSKFGLY